jgi:hypothetical protein
VNPLERMYLSMYLPTGRESPGRKRAPHHHFGHSRSVGASAWDNMRGLHAADQGLKLPTDLVALLTTLSVSMVCLAGIYMTTEELAVTNATPRPPRSRIGYEIFSRLVQGCAYFSRLPVDAAGFVEFILYDSGCCPTARPTRSVLCLYRQRNVDLGLNSEHSANLFGNQILVPFDLHCLCRWMVRASSEPGQLQLYPRISDVMSPTYIAYLAHICARFLQFHYLLQIRS